MSEKIDIQELRRAVMNNAKKAKLSIKKYLDVFDIDESMYYKHVKELNPPRDYKHVKNYMDIIQTYKKRNENL